jgi:hypothetical protein
MRCTWLVVLVVLGCGKKEEPRDFKLQSLSVKRELDDRVEMTFYARNSNGTSGWETGEYDLVVKRDGDPTPICAIKGTTQRNLSGIPFTELHPCKLPGDDVKLIAEITYRTQWAESKETYKFPTKEDQAAVDKQLEPFTSKLDVEVAALGAVKAKLPKFGDAAKPCDSAAFEGIAAADRATWLVDAQLLDPSVADRARYMFLDHELYTQLHDYRTKHSARWDDAMKLLSSHAPIVAVVNAERRAYPTDVALSAEKEFNYTPGVFDATLTLVDWRNATKQVLCHAPISLTADEATSFKVDARWASDELKKKVEEHYRWQVRRSIGDGLASMTQNKLTLAP